MNFILEDLRLAYASFLKKMAEKDAYSFNLDQDYYNRLLDPHNPRKGFGIGSLWDDWEELQDIFDPERWPSSVDVGRLGNMFIALGHEMGEPIKTTTANYLHINLDRLQEILAFLLAHNFSAASAITFDRENYWKLSDKDLFNFDDLDNLEVVTGSICDDLNKLDEVVNQGRQASAEDLACIGNLIVILGEGTGWHLPNLD